MRRSDEEEAGRWLAQANADLEDARFNRDGSRHNVACFLSHQAAEKCLKAFLYATPEGDPWGHSVNELCREASSYEKEFAELASRVVALDQYYIPTRYPNGLPGGAFPKCDHLTA